MLALEIILAFLFWLLICLFVGAILHELGHFGAALWFTNLLPTRLEVGKGPTLLSRETPFRLRISLLPIGGCVAYAGEPGEPAPISGRASWDSASHRDRLVAAIGGPFIHATAFVTILLVLHLDTSDRGLLWNSLVFNCLGQVALAVSSLRPNNVSDGGHIYRAVRSLPVGYKFGLAWRLADPLWIVLIVGVTLVIGKQLIAIS